MVGRLIFLTSNLTTRLIQKISTNIVKFKSLLKNFNKENHNKRSDILHKFLNKTSDQTSDKKIKQPIKTTYNLERRE